MDGAKWDDLSIHDVQGGLFDSGNQELSLRRQSTGLSDVTLAKLSLRALVKLFGIESCVWHITVCGSDLLCPESIPPETFDLK